MGNFDGLRDLTVTYNALKHPKTVSSGTTSTVTYIYDAGGNKLAVSQDGTVKNYYCGDFVYTSGFDVDYILTPNGQMTRNPSMGTYTAQYNITDHLGNVRSVVNSSGTVLQSTDYYPFGLAFSDANITNNRYLYNGKELENYTIGSSYLGTLDYGARHYDARIGRWTVPDPMAEKYYGLSSFNYCAGNPMMLVDPFGEEILLRSVAQYTNSIPKYVYSTVLDEDYGPYSILAYYDSNDKIVGYGAVKSVNKGQGSVTRWDYVMTSESDLPVFAENISTLSLAADLVYAKNELSQGMIELLSGDVVSGLAKQWKEAVTDPSFYLELITVAGLSALTLDDPCITIGNNPNQYYHAFRHTDKVGLNRDLVRRSVMNDVRRSYHDFIPRKPNNRTISINGIEIQNTAFQRSKNYYNVGRIQVNKK